MVNKTYSEELKGGPEPIDESWWAAVLAEEERTGDKRVEPPPPDSSSHPRQAKVNWDRARKIYDSDETVTLEVVDYNRGGLLVESDDLQGFVPISHLVDID